MTLGQVIDYCLTWNDANGVGDKNGNMKRKATQADWDKFLGG